MKRRKVAIVLSGCGVFDGSEIHEAVAVLMSVEREGAEPVFFAPDKPQASVVNHKTGSESAGESRNVLVESARIARGKVFPLYLYLCLASFSFPSYFPAVWVSAADW